MSKTATIKGVTHEEARVAKGALVALIGAAPGVLPKDHPALSMWRKLDEAAEATKPGTRSAE